MNEDNLIIQSLWIGPTFSPLERLSIKSFLSNGHDFHLYVYDDIKNIPEGVIIKDANRIVKKGDIFLGQRNDGKFVGFEAFSDFFRYKLLYENGGWWVDLDVICLQSFDFSEKYVFASHLNNPASRVPVSSGCVMKLPAKSDEAEYCIEKCINIKDKKTITYSAIGPMLVAEVIKLYHQECFIQKGNVFCPINWWEVDKIVKPNEEFQITAEMHAIHCFNVKWPDFGFDKNKTFHEYSIFEQLKSFYGV